MTMGMPGVTKTSQFSFSIAVYSSASVLIALLHCNEVAISPQTFGALIRQRFDAACALAAKQPIAEISANAEAIADSVPSRNASRRDNGSVPVQSVHVVSPPCPWGLPIAHVTSSFSIRRLNAPN